MDKTLLSLYGIILRCHAGFDSNCYVEYRTLFEHMACMPENKSKPYNWLNEPLQALVSAKLIRGNGDAYQPIAEFVRAE